MRNRETIEKRGWTWMPPYGWSHPDVRDDGGHLRIFDNVEQVMAYEGIEVEQEKVK